MRLRLPKFTLHRRLLAWVWRWVAYGSSMRLSKRLATYLILLGSIWGVIWAIAITLVSTAPTAYTTRWVVILPGTGAGLAVSLESIGQASAQSSSPYGNTSVDPKVNYQAIATSDPVLLKAAEKSASSYDDFASLKIKLVDQTALMNFSITAPTAEQAYQKAISHYQSLQEVLAFLRKDEFATREQSTRLSVDIYEKTLKQTERKLLEFQRQSKIVSADQFQSLLVSLSNLKEKIDQTNAQLDAAKIKRDTLMARLGVSSTQAGQALVLHRDAEFQALMQERATLGSTIAEQRGKWGARHPEVLTSQAGLDALDREMLTRARQLLSSSLTRAEFKTLSGFASRSTQEALIQQIVSFEITYRGLKSELDNYRITYQARERTLNETVEEAARLQALQREQQVATAVYTTALAKMDIAKIDPFTSYPMLQMLAPPLMPEQPDKLGKKLTLLGAVGATLFATIGMVLLWIRKPYLRKLQKSE
ncbi:GumC family protein [Larsenimonas salina]|uniref:GumC family protein n=1 Tax=Larsenimonas salina TaxID=1295565 RepID=UPI0020733FAA|nr:hypothetical protein [Larsenimonas salina]MCM5703277.1 hypothetical protein [Larsenimonas salina]